MCERIFELRWDRLQRQIRQRWGEVRQKDLQGFDGDMHDLAELIHERTDEALPCIQQEIADLILDRSRVRDEHLQQTEQLMAEASKYAEQAQDTVRTKVQQAGRLMHAKEAEAKLWVSRRPLQTVAIACGVGIALGLGAALLIRER